MSIKYDSVADIPEDLKLLAENRGNWKWPGHYYISLIRSGGEYMAQLGVKDGAYARKQFEAAKECLARCEGQAVKWDGKGDLPPVGAECSVTPHNTMWGFDLTDVYCGYVVAYDGEYFWWKNSGGFQVVSRVDKVDFEPIKTEAELQAERESEERTEAAKALNQIIHSKAVMTQDDAWSLAKFIATEGYRRAKGSDEV